MNKKEFEELKALSFEKALQELEAIVSKMERGELLLDDMMVAYEKGQALSEICSKKLKSVEKKIEILKNKSNGESAWEEFDSNETPSRQATQPPTTSFVPPVPPATVKREPEPVDRSSDDEFLF